MVGAQPKLLQLIVNYCNASIHNEVNLSTHNHIYILFLKKIIRNLVYILNPDAVSVCIPFDLLTILLCIGTTLKNNIIDM